MIYIHCNAGKGHRATYHDILNGYNCWCGRPFLATDEQKEQFLKQERSKREPQPLSEDEIKAIEQENLKLQQAAVERRKRIQRINDGFWYNPDSKRWEPKRQ